MILVVSMGIMHVAAARCMPASATFVAVVVPLLRGPASDSASAASAMAVQTVEAAA